MITIQHNYLIHLLRKGYNALLDFIFYPYCYICEKRLDSGAQLICNRCWKSFRQPAGGTQLLPEDFRLDQKVYFKKAYILYTYSENILKVIHLYKYKKKSSLGTYIGKDIGAFLSCPPALPGFDALIPVPLHTIRFRERGYNQSEILAKQASTISNIPVITDCIKRTVNNPSQTGLTLQERKQNVKGIFEVIKPDKVSGKKLLIVDDVMTTGITMNECAKTLTKAGAREITCIAVIHPGSAM